VRDGITTVSSAVDAPSASGATPMVAGQTHVGRERKINEDAVAVASIERDGVGRRFAVVCDGIAGGAHGELASSFAAQAALAALVEDDRADAEFSLRRAVAMAHRAICEAGIEDVRGKDEPGTTLVAAIARATFVDVAWVGDSRAYLLPPSPAPAELLTHDHSWVNLVVDAGDLDEEEARASKWAQVITRCLGPAEDPDPLKPPEPSIRSIQVAPSSRLILCSDGFWAEFAGPDALAAAVAAAPDPGDAAALADWLVERALEAGGADDITVAVVLL
jgi:serine/threonine protein phosphatase PrpC